MAWYQLPQQTRKQIIATELKSQELLLFPTPEFYHTQNEQLSSS